MKNVINIKRSHSSNKNILRRNAVKNRSQSSRKKWQSALLVLLISALVSVSLTRSDKVVPKAQAQTVLCSSDVLPDRIFQKCQLGNGEVERALEEQAINDVLELHHLSPSDRGRLLSDGRNQLRAAIFLRLLELIKKPAPTISEQQVLATLAARMKQKRVDAATKALERYYVWRGNPCAFIPTTGFADTDALDYDPGQTCRRNPIGVILFGSPLSPAFEEFQQFGGLEAYKDLATPDAQLAGSLTASHLATYGGLGAAGVGGAVGAFVGSLLPESALTAIFPFRKPLYTPGLQEEVALARNTEYAKKGAEAAKEVAKAVRTSGSLKSPFSGVSLSGGVVTIVVTAITIAVTRGLAVINSSLVEGKLQAAVAEAQNATLDLRQLIKDSQGIQETYGAFILTTLPEADAASVPPPASANDRKFTVGTEGSTTTTDSLTISYRDWNFNCHTARLNGGWFVDRDQTGNEQLTLSIAYKDWRGDKVTASRSGAKFLLSTGEAFDGAKGPDAKQEVEELQFLDCSNTLAHKVARIRFDEMTVTSNPQVTATCVQFFPENGQDVNIGSVAGTSDNPSSLAVTVNDQASATINGITVRNLTINSQYKITANVVALAPAPITADFTVTVTNTLGQTSSAPFKVKKTAIIEAFVPSVTTNIDVGAPYFSYLRDIITVGSCSVPSTFAITEGALPPGLNLVIDHSTLFAVPQIQGTPTAAGLYTFTVTETLSNGEQQSGAFLIFVKHAVAAMPDGVVSWWRGDGNAEDYFNHHHGSIVGSAGFDSAYINEAFRFNGLNGYTALPGDTFDSSRNFTYELWFKTATQGAILGWQQGTIPYQTPIQGTHAPIYVGSDGKLHVRMFGSDGEPFTASPSRVDDNVFHHLAVVYSRASAIEEVYLDGQLIGTMSGVSSVIDPSAVYQLGTGYVSDSQLNMTGWFNFNGLIDEVTLYDRTLTANEIKAIYQAGDAGKFYINPVPVSPSIHNGTDGAITVLARGGAGGLRYSRDNGVTFQDNNTFYDLSAGTYQIAVEDILGRSITRAVAIVNPPLTLSLAAASSSPTCPSSRTGRIALQATGASGPVEYSLSNGANRQTSNVFETLPAGTYTPWVKDLNTGTVFTGQPIVLTDPPQLTISPSIAPAAVAGHIYSQTFTSSGGTGVRLLTASNLPPWLTAASTASGLTLSGTPSQSGSSTISIRVEDANSCVKEENINLVVVAPCATPPNISTCPGARSVSANTNCQAVISDFSQALVATDACTPGAPLNVVQNPASGTLVGLGTTNVTLTVMDANNNRSTCTTSFTVLDAAPPVLSNCPANITVNTTAQQCAAIVTFTPPTATDNCSGSGTPLCTPASGSSFAKGTTTVTCSVSDAANNQASCTFTVTVNDNQPPTVATPANITKNTDPNQCSAVVTYALPTASDNCPLPPNAVVCSPPSGATFSKGTTTVTCRVTDAASLTGSSTFTVMVNDNQPPQITCPANIVKGTDANQCSAVVTYATPTATDNCSGVGAVVCTPSSGTTFPKGTTSVTCTARDTANNLANCSFTIAVNDTQAPSIACPGNISVPAAPGQCSATVTYGAPAVGDNCPGIGTPVCVPLSGSTFAKGTTVVNCLVRDAANNQANCSFMVTVSDSQAPVIICPANMITNTVNAGDATVIVNFVTPTASDNCSGVSVVCSPPSGSALPRGTTTVTCTATDAAGNQTSCSFTVRVYDYVIVDDSNGKILRFDSVTGDYDFFDCRKGTSLSGRGVVTISSCKTALSDTGPDSRHPDRNLIVTANPCTKVGSATLTYQNVTHGLNDPNLSNNIVRCP